MAAPATYQIVALNICVFCVVGELFCYIVIFLQVLMQDNGRIKTLLSPHITKERNRKNIMTFSGQFLHFATETAFLLTQLVVLAFDRSNIGLRTVAMTFKVVEFAFLSMVDVLASNKLRTALFKDIQAVNIFHKQD